MQSPSHHGHCSLCGQDNILGYLLADEAEGSTECKEVFCCCGCLDSRGRYPVVGNPPLERFHSLESIAIKPTAPAVDGQAPPRGTKRLHCVDKDGNVLDVGVMMTADAVKTMVRHAEIEGTEVGEAVKHAKVVKQMRPPTNHGRCSLCGQKDRLGHLLAKDTDSLFQHQEVFVCCACLDEQGRYPVVGNPPLGRFPSLEGLETVEVNSDSGDADADGHPGAAEARAVKRRATKRLHCMDEDGKVLDVGVVMAADAVETMQQNQAEEPGEPCLPPPCDLQDNCAAEDLPAVQVC